MKLRYSLSLLPLALTALATSAAERPNVLFIMVDDLKPTLGCYGDAKAITPNIDRLARSSVLFDRAYTNQAVCAPSRNAVLSGLRPTTVGVYDLVTNFRLGAPEAVTLPQRFAQAGYRVETLGKVYHRGNGNASDAAALATPHWDWNENRLYAAERSDRPATECLDVPDETYVDAVTAGETIRRLSAAAEHPAQPFFLILGIRKPHLPFTAPKKYWDLHAATEFSADGPAVPPADSPKFAGHSWGELRAYSDVDDVGPVDATKAAELVRGYYAATSFADAQIGRVLDALDRLKLAENTIVVLWGDHGWHLGDHGWWCKHTNYEQANRIPILIRAPGVSAPGARSSSFIESVDLFPTLCDLAGLSVPAGVEGVSQRATLRDPAVVVRTEAMHVYPRGENIGRAVRDERYRLVEWKKAGAPAASAVVELYDYQTDPLETRNVAAEQPEVVSLLRSRLAQLPEARPQIKDDSPKGQAAAERRQRRAKQ